MLFPLPCPAEEGSGFAGHLAFTQAKPKQTVTCPARAAGTTCGDCPGNSSLRRAFARDMPRAAPPGERGTGRVHGRCPGPGCSAWELGEAACLAPVRGDYGCQAAHKRGNEKSRGGRVHLAVALSAVHFCSARCSVQRTDSIRGMVVWLMPRGAAARVFHVAGPRWSTWR